MKVGYFIGGLACLLYGAMCVWIGVKKPEKFFALTKKKMFNASEKNTQIICIVVACIAVIAAVFLFYFGARNA